MDFNINDFYADENEKPLDKRAVNGGFVRILDTLGCVGDSLSSGEFEAVGEDGKTKYLDEFGYSWGQVIARTAGIKVYNFSKGGMTAWKYCEEFAWEKGFWAPELKCRAYIIALGVNDLVNQKQELGTLDDIDTNNYMKNAKTFTGYYAQIIQHYKKINPFAKFFLMTMPRQYENESEERIAIRDAHQKRLYELAGFFDNCYVLHLRKYGPVYDQKFRDNFYLRHHMNPMGYVVTAEMVMSYIDYIIRHNPDDFKTIGLQNTPYMTEKEVR